MRIAWLLLSLCLLAPAAFADNKQLQIIDNLRLTESQKAYNLFKELNPSSLSADERLQYRYLDGFFSTYFERLDDALSKYQQLYADAKGKPIQLRVLVSMLGVSSFASKWKESFEYADELSERLKEFTNPADKIDAYRGLLTFHRNVEQPEIALVFLDRMLAEPTISDQQICYARSVSNEIRLDMKASALTASVIIAAEDICESVGQTF